MAQHHQHLPTEEYIDPEEARSAFLPEAAAGQEDQSGQGLCNALNRNPCAKNASLAFTCIGLLGLACSGVLYFCPGRSHLQPHIAGEHASQAKDFIEGSQVGTAAVLQKSLVQDLQRARRSRIRSTQAAPEPPRDQAQATARLAGPPKLMELVSLTHDSIDTVLECLTGVCATADDGQKSIDACAVCLSPWFRASRDALDTSATEEPARSEQPRSLSDAPRNPLNVDIPAASFEAKAANSGPLGYLHLCKGKVKGCKPTYDNECYGPGSICYNTWQDVWDWGSQIPEGQWNGTLWRGHELGTGFLSPYLWSSRGIDPFAALGVEPNQHAAVRPALEKMWGTGGKNSAEYRRTEDMVRASIQEFLADRRKNGLKVDMLGDVMAWAHQVLYKKAFKRDITLMEGKVFMVFQLLYLGLALQSDTEPVLAKVPFLLPTLRQQVARIVRSYEPIVQEMYADDLDGLDCSPSTSCVTQLASAILDAFLLAGGVSLTVSINAGIALLYSTAEPMGTPYSGNEEVENPPDSWLAWGNPFPDMAYEHGQELQFYWEVLRYFAPVGSVASWTKPVTCAGLSEDQTKALLKDGGASQPCPLEGYNLPQDIPRVNQYTGGAGHIFPVLPVAMRDPAKFGADANTFRIRELDVYKWSVGFGEMAENSKVANGMMNRSCPGKSFTLMVGSLFFEEFNKQDWVVPRDSKNITFSQGSKPFHMGFTLSSQAMVAECKEICPSALKFPELHQACTAAKQRCHCDSCGAENRLLGSWSCVQCALSGRTRELVASPKPWGGEGPRPAFAELARCPALLAELLNVAGGAAVQAYQESGTPTALLELLNAKAKGSPVLWKNLVDPFAVLFYFSLKMTISAKSASHSDSIAAPSLYGSFETMTYGDITVPVVDLDGYVATTPLDPKLFDSELMELLGFPPNHAQSVLQVCLTGPFMLDQAKHDWLEDGDRNTWAQASVGLGRSFLRKKDWIMSLWAPYTLADNVAMWPKTEVDFGQLFLKADLWDDGLEQAIAFSSIGTHRLETTKRDFGGEQLAFVVSLNAFASLEVRPGFGRYGGDMYFSEAGMPVLVVTPDGTEVSHASKDWQYWKFVWRSSLFSIITLQDHLNTAHYKVANVLATSTRRQLQPDHPARRVLTVFSWGSININYDSMFALSLEGSALSRAMPVKDFGSLAETVPESLPDIMETVRYFANESRWAQLPRQLQQAPFYADGLLLFRALRGLVQGYFDLFRDQWCDQDDDALTDSGLLALEHDLASTLAAANYQGDYTGRKTCTQAAERVTAALYIVTAYHRHVGQVGDVAVDPEVAAFSWREGERSARPMQALITSTIAAATAVPQPKLDEDFSHVFEGMHREGQARALWAKFREELRGVSQTVRERNAQRTVPYYRADPSIVECSVAI
mmetsp:Transcript_29840/g.75157  ORF Transcript_29840/g.75157 Transcript_29840/m.75157 type:complete len:1398 (+) Transcript_29840:84-4277(+)